MTARIYQLQQRYIPPPPAPAPEPVERGSYLIALVAAALSGALVGAFLTWVM